MKDEYLVKILELIANLSDLCADRLENKISEDELQNQTEDFIETFKEEGDLDEEEDN